MNNTFKDVMMHAMPTTPQKIVTLRRLQTLVPQLKKKGLKVVHCHGVFDLIHPGHIRHFTSAKAHGDILIVTLTADKFVKKGPGRPIFTENLRAEVLAALAMIDYVAIVHDLSALPAIEMIKPQVYIKGPDYKERKTTPQLPRKLTSEEALVKKYGGTIAFTDDGVIFSSSHLINRYLEPYPRSTKNYLMKLRQHFSSEAVIEILGKLRTKKVLIIGDTIIDEYHYTTPLGRSSKEPIIVHKFEGAQRFAGGTLATANHIATLAQEVTLVTLLGNRPSYESFIRRKLRPNIKPLFFYHKRAPTIIKRRFLDFLTKQKLFQVSLLRDELLPEAIETKVSAALKKLLAEYEIVVVNDFGHGLLTPTLVKLITKQAKYLCLNVQANSANYGFNIVTKYPRADFICMDETEIRLAIHDKHRDIYKVIPQIAKKMHCQELIVTRGADGSVSFKNHVFVNAPSLAANVVDRVGAGDAFFAIAAPCAAAGLNQQLVSFLGNVAGALKVQTLGNKQPLDFADVAKFVTRLLK